MPTDTQPEEVLTFWFGALDGDGLASETASARWYRKSSTFDADVRARFEACYTAIVDQERQHWLETANGWLASVIVLDQFSRNMFRDSAQMYAADDLARELVERGIAAGFDIQFKGHPRTFAYMPLMHSESLADQDRCVALFEKLVVSATGPAKALYDTTLKYALAHQKIVAEWGRFPHRNGILGRSSTPAEQAFLEQPGSGF